VDKGTLGVHEIELVGEGRPGLGDSSGVGKHADSAINLGKIAVGNHLRWLVANTNLETSWAPVDELDGALGLEGSNSTVHILGDDISTVKEASSHVFAVTGVALHHLVVRLEARHGDLLDRVGLVGSLGSRYNRSVSNEREMDTWVRHQVGLELVEINVEGTIEAQGGGDGRDNYRRVSKLQVASRYQ
jgi:hypothetical protein